MSGDLYSIGSAGLRSYRSQISTISQNISNSGSENYTRRNTPVQESFAAGSTQVLYRSFANFAGSEAAGVYRVSDPLLDAKVRDTGAKLANSNTHLRWMTDIETALKDDKTGVGSSIGNFYGMMDQLAANPTSQPLRNTALYQLEQVTDAFKASSSSLNDMFTSTKASADSDATLVNDSLKQLQEINRGLLNSQDGTENKAMLEDSRDALLNTLSAKLNVSIEFGAKGNATVSYGGAVLADSTSNATVAVTQAGNGALGLAVNGTAVTAPTGGSMGATVAAATTTRARLDELDALAVSFANNINSWHAAGQTDAGAPGADLISGTSAATLAVTTSNPADLAVATSDGRTNGNLLDLSALRPTHGTEKSWDALISKQGNAVKSAKLDQASAAGLDEAARVERDKLSGVDLDREAADLLRVQQAYQASAKIIQVAKDLIDTMLNI
ncbi:MAG: flagellar hook-associated protein FlgK [Sphingobium sp.]|nr:flagellar hook-associated protein FlgK [Sphingobium sp.]